MSDNDDINDMMDQSWAMTASYNAPIINAPIMPEDIGHRMKWGSSHHLYNVSHSYTYTGELESTMILPYVDDITMNKVYLQLAHIMEDEIYKRSPFESFMEWTKRLSSSGLLDDGRIRWHWQKAMWVSIWKWMRAGKPE